ncbi:hypothetical protein GPX89_09830 [Nocardia sp. ET3-3]|uniref:Uncharacterized protein n=1 Tax=Nocardia terrae TaxID=2675851 RepID=A0A7K1UTD4_9NOCA|nr:hypothetical protein [Nocardia terrae]MVU77541.1 hypothetical protein [Nocardia terrae]
MADAEDRHDEPPAQGSAVTDPAAEPRTWRVRVSLPTDFPADQVAPYAAHRFGARFGTVDSAGWHREVFEQRTRINGNSEQRLQLVLRVTRRPGGGSYVRLSMSAIPNREKRDEVLPALQGELNRLGRFLDEAARLRRHTRQAIVIVHGIGEQLPGQTLRSFMAGVFGTPSTEGPYLKPDYISSLFELRMMRVGRDLASGRPTTDVYELYWAHLVRDTTLGQVYGWLSRLMLAPDAQIPVALRKYFWFVRVLLVAVAATVGWFVHSRTGQAATTAVTVGALALVPMLAWGVLRAIGRRFLLGFIGDAARYLEPRPGNVERRQAIREAGVRLLNGLHDSGEYSRIIVFGHSLGSVIAYDILNLTWIRRRRRHDAETIMTSRALIRAENLLNAENEPSIEEIRACQFAAWEEYRRNSFRWLVSDFITAGSPLTSARLLLNLDKRTPFDTLVADRSFPTCPPQTETVRTPVPGRTRRRFTHTYAYPDPASTGRTRSVQIPHHAAMFGLVRWTNLYFPLRGVLGGDPVGGPLREIFGLWIRDVEVPQPRAGWAGFTHSLYWHHRGNDAHIRCLRDALALPFHATLDELTAELHFEHYSERENLSPVRASEDLGSEQPAYVRRSHRLWGRRRHDSRA